MLTTRGILVHPHEFDKIWIDKASSLGLTTLGIHPVGGKNAAQSLQDLLDHHDRLALLIAYAHEKGLKVEYQMHALSWLMPRELFASHPLWFRIDDNGERNADFNMCPSNDEALRYLTDRAEQLTEMLPSDNHLYYYWIDDVPDGICHCEHCRNLTASDQQTIILNAMLKGIRKADPQGRLSWLAYFNTAEVPHKVRPEDNLFLEFAPFKRSFNYAMNDPRCPENQSETKNLIELINCFGKKDALVLEYWTDNSLFSNWTMPPKQFKLNAEIMREDVKWYRSLGFDAITAFGCYLGAEYRALYGMPELDAYGEILCE